MIRSTWKEVAADHNFRFRQVKDSNPDALRRALRMAARDSNAQVIYLSCHGSTRGLLYSKPSKQAVEFSTLGLWLADMRKEPSGCCTLVMGFCHAMDPSVGIERYMPSWIGRVIGFADEPTGLDVAKLAASYPVNLSRWVHETIAGMDGMLDSEGISPERTSEDDLRRSFETAADASPDDPAMFVPDDCREFVIAATRVPDTDDWNRQYGRNFRRWKPN